MVTGRTITFSDGIKCFRTWNLNFSNQYQTQYRHSLNPTLNYIEFSDNPENKCVLAYGVIRDDWYASIKLLSFLRTKSSIAKLNKNDKGI